MTGDQIAGGLIAALAAVALAAGHMAARLERQTSERRRTALRYGTHPAGCVYCGTDHATFADCPEH